MIYDVAKGCLGCFMTHQDFVEFEKEEEQEDYEENEMRDHALGLLESHKSCLYNQLGGFEKKIFKFYLRFFY